MAPTRVESETISVDLGHDLLHLEDIHPDLREVGSSNICYVCGFEIFTAAIVCSNDSCGSGETDEPATCHSRCIGKEESEAVVPEYEWFCPRCSKNEESTGEQSRFDEQGEGSSTNQRGKRKSQDPPQVQPRKKGTKLFCFPI
ncbi:uncharacterized protein [Amphiura filiformis]|uniref:uncharacterized protein n=1 Tax=Amphiura filiformis TaxID=82378 RepID=UPI003B20E559